MSQGGEVEVEGMEDDDEDEEDERMQYDNDDEDMDEDMEDDGGLGLDQLQVHLCPLGLPSLLPSNESVKASFPPSIHQTML